MRSNVVTDCTSTVQRRKIAKSYCRLGSYDPDNGVVSLELCEKHSTERKCSDYHRESCSNEKREKLNKDN